MAVTRQGRPLIDGTAEGEVLRVAAPLSFWGGVDPKTGTITQPKHPDHQACIADKVLALPHIIGSSSSSTILLELIHQGKAPRAILVGEPDAIIALGVLVAQEMGMGSLPIVHCPLDGLETGMRVRLCDGGAVEVVD